MSIEAAAGIARVVPALTAGISGAGIGQVDPSVFTSLSAASRGVVSFVLMFLLGALIQRFGDGYVEESIDSIVDSPATAVLYGIAGYGIVGLVGLYGATTLARVSVAGGILVRIGILVSGGAILLLTGFGFLVVGTLLTDLVDSRRSTYGLLITALLSAVIWVVLSPVSSLVVTLGVAAFGLGGSARIWVHSERTVETETRSQ